MRLNEKLAIVTAGGSGMGRAGCELFAKEGATVAVVDINEENIAATVDAITSDGGKAKGFKANLADVDDTKRVIAESTDWLGGLDLLWSHAGTTGPSAFEDLPMKDYEFAMDLNVRSSVVCASESIQHMRRRGGGSIVFTSSMGGLVGSTMSPTYSVTKFGIVGLTMSLAQRYALEKIRVNAVCPGPIETPMMPSFFSRPGDEAKAEDNLKRVMGLVPMGRVAQPIEVAYAVLFLLSDEASFITGVPLPVDGGVVCR
ncbi:SDR family oxidoreductase [Gordonia sp. TBRC 11910]|uniref:SDR family oxidoreductase n=1 Tax=Gordonia asplenii TaxID=2725283 RepID=A0A848KXP5_9ACTN|nr:SDR family oxidoreductase [Gordonia asplenii]NMO01625.1 SDR family oxidoreductase [Gordonia asplenii]